MKSKISFFNKTIFQKNMTLYWPIWLMYTVLLLISQPIMLWTDCYYSNFYDAYTYSDHLEDLINVIYLDSHVYFIALTAVFTGMALFNYMYNHKSANMIHALPVDRTQLFGTNVISGLFFLAGPQTISACLTAVVALSNGIKEVHYIAYWLLLAFGTDIVAMAVVTFCAMFTGHILALPVYALVVNYFSYWVYYIIYIIVSMFSFGVNSLGINEQKIVALFSPTECFRYNIGLCPDRDQITGECVGVLVNGLDVLAIYLAAAVALFAAAYVTYKKRHIEQAGEFITVSWVKPIARFIVAVTGGFFGGMLVREFLRSVGIGCNLAGFLIIMVLIGALAYFVADMLICKSFRVFKKRNWIECAICSILMIGLFFGIYGVAKSYEDYQPELAEIDSVSISMGYEIELEGEEAAAILEIHEAILANKEICIAEKESGNWNCEYVSIDYILKDGQYICRVYELPYGYEEIEAIFDKIAVMEQDVDRYLQYIFAKNYKEIENFSGGSLQAPYRDTVYINAYDEWDYTYDSKSFTSKQAEEMFEAVIADANAGTLMKYNVHSQWIREGNPSDSWHTSPAGITIDFQVPGEQYETVLEAYSITYPESGDLEYVEDVESWYSAYISFGPDCENIVNKLIEFGFITSVDDLYWGEMSEEKLMQ